MFERRDLKFWSYMAIGIVGELALVFGILALFRSIHGPMGWEMHMAATTLAVTPAVIWVFVFGVKANRHRDEFQQHRSRVAWYWGGVAGLIVAVPIYALIISGAGYWLFWPAKPIGDTAHIAAALGRAFTIGFYLPVTLQFAGFLIVRLWWRLAKR
jgi:NADH:ubiquinone oxidoreductase subunit 6 (subunit J)